MRRHLAVFLSAISLVLLAVFTLRPTSRVKADDDNHVIFTTIDFLSATSSLGRDVASADGAAYVGEYDDTAGHHGFLLRKGQFTSFDFPGADAATNALAINPRGDIVGSYLGTSGQIHGFLLKTSW